MLENILSEENIMMILISWRHTFYRSAFGVVLHILEFRKVYQLSCYTSPQLCHVYQTVM